MKRVSTKIVCPRCLSERYEVREKGPHIGAYCEVCGTWIRWLPKIGESCQDNELQSLLDTMPPSEF